jgi:hypothetical protein
LDIVDIVTRISAKVEREREKEEEEKKGSSFLMFSFLFAI